MEWKARVVLKNSLREYGLDDDKQLLLRVDLMLPHFPALMNSTHRTIPIIKPVAADKLFDLMGSQSEKDVANIFVNRGLHLGIQDWRGWMKDQAKQSKGLEKDSARLDATSSGTTEANIDAIAGASDPSQGQGDMDGVEETGKVDPELIEYSVVKDEVRS